MIEPMKRVSIVLLDKDREEALVRLRRLGLVHLENVEGKGGKLARFREISGNAVFAFSVLSEIRQSKKSPKNEDSFVTDEQVVSVCSEIVAGYDRKKQLLEEIASDAAELERFGKWGDVSLEDLAFLRSRGVDLRLYEISADKYSMIDGGIQTLLVNNDRKTVRFLVVNGGDSRPANLLPEAFEVPEPRVSTPLLEKEIEEDTAEIARIEADFADKVRYIGSIRKFLSVIESDIEFETVNSGMEREAESENSLAWISGYVPASDTGRLKSACAEYGWAVACSDPDDSDDNVPTKLRNNRLVSLIYPLTDFLGTVPGYHEYDISGWFLFFFTIFFGMIFGDGGYGLIVTAGALALVLKSRLSGKTVPAAAGLVLLVGISTVIWGTVTCTWFGLGMDMIPQWLKNLSVPQISNAYSDVQWKPFWKDTGTLTTAQNLQIFCFSLALFQLSVAHIKCMSRNRKSLKAVGDFGSLIQLVGMFYVVLSMVVSSSVFSLGEVIYGVPVGKIAVALILAGFVLSFIFANYDGSIGKSVLESCRNIISVLLGVVNVFSDIVSYIRLWAVGLAGAAISGTVNDMAGPLLGHLVTFMAFVLLVCFGHGLNMVLNLLSVIVHGVRLNTLEFSNHLGMSWSGFKYSPFREKNA